MKQCEWNPLADRPSYTTEAGCALLAVYIIKYDGDEMQICEACAELPPFKGKKRRAMSKNEGARECITHHDACDCREAKIKRLIGAAEELDDYLGFMPEWHKKAVVRFREALEDLE